MADRRQLEESFRDTVNWSIYNDKLNRLTEEAKKSTIVYDEDYINETKVLKSFNTHIEVVEGTTFNVARRYVNKGSKVAVLNFANPHNPGGGVVNGAMAQEECLCRSSNLYQCLTTDVAREDYYDYNIKYTNYLFSDRVIFSDNVTVFKDDSVIPVMMKEEDWFRVSVITCAAPYLGQTEKIVYPVLKDIFKKRIRNILEAAYRNNIDILILGAFGCGAFKNPPRLVAEAFEETIMEEYKGMFKEIIFAIKKTSEECPNYNAFKEVFAQYMSEGQKIKEQPDSKGTEDVSTYHAN